MKCLHRFFVLPASEKRLIILSLFIVFAVRLSLSFLPFSLAKKLISAGTHAPLLTFTDPVTTDRIAHAWIECADGVIIGGKGDGSFTPLPSLDRVRS
jgi:hypothetical protein